MGYLDGFGVTIKKWLGPGTDSGRRVTLQYPEQTRPKPERFHGRHVLNRYDDGMEKCIGCELCAGVCPARCIYVRGRDNDPDDPTSPGERYGFIYEINYLRCIHCDLCVEACPTEAITETKLFEFAFTNRSDAIYTKDELVVGDDGRPQQLPWENWEGGFDPAQDASGWMRATAPGGDADFVGIVAWAGELGYGVRAPEGGGRVDASVAADLDTPVPADAAAHDDHAHEAEAPAAAEPVTASPMPDETTAVEPAHFDLELQEPPAALEHEPTPPSAPPARPLLVDAVDEPEDEPEDAAPSSSQRAGLFDAPEGASARVVGRTADHADADVPVEQHEADDADDADVAAEVDRLLDEPAQDDAPAEPSDEPAPEPAPAPDAPVGPSAGPGYFDLPDAPADEPTPPRRKRGWGRR